MILAGAIAKTFGFVALVLIGLGLLIGFALSSMRK